MTDPILVLTKMVGEGDIKGLVANYSKDTLLHAIGDVLPIWRTLKSPMAILGLRLALGPPSSEMLYYAVSKPNLHSALLAVLIKWPSILPLYKESYMGKPLKEHLESSFHVNLFPNYLAFCRAVGYSALHTTIDALKVFPKDNLPINFTPVVPVWLGEYGESGTMGFKNAGTRLEFFYQGGSGNFSCAHDLYDELTTLIVERLAEAVYRCVPHFFKVGDYQFADFIKQIRQKVPSETVAKFGIFTPMSAAPSPYAVFDVSLLGHHFCYAVYDYGRNVLVQYGNPIWDEGEMLRATGGWSPTYLGEIPGSL